MKTTKNVLNGLLIGIASLIYFPAQAQPKKQEVTKELSTSLPPNSIVRTIKKDGNGNIWMASWQGIFKYNTHLADEKGKSFINITSKVSSARFFSVLQDRKGNFWFASIGSGVYYYDGKSFVNFTTKDGLASDRVTNIYEDKAGKIWFGTEAGASLYDGKTFRNFKMRQAKPVTQNDSTHVSVYQNSIPEDSWMHNDVNAIIEDKTGKLWFATRGYTFIYDAKQPGNGFTTITNKDGKPFANIRSIIKDKKGNMWMGGFAGLWRYDGKSFSNFSKRFVGHIYEDKKGNIWTSSESDPGMSKILYGNRANEMAWVLSRYDEKTLTAKKPLVTEIARKPMIFGILEDDKRDIWFGAVDGVHRYDGKTIADFNK